MPKTETRQTKMKISEKQKQKSFDLAICKGNPAFGRIIKPVKIKKILK